MSILNMKHRIKELESKLVGGEKTNSDTIKKRKEQRKKEFENYNKKVLGATF